MTAETPTPLTDKVAYMVDEDPLGTAWTWQQTEHEVVPADFARHLERIIAEADCNCYARNQGVHRSDCFKSRAARREG